MEECKFCLSKKKRNKKKHEQSKKRKIFSNLIINKYIEKVFEFYRFNDTIQPYYDKHKNKFDNFTVCVRWMYRRSIVNKISVPSSILYWQELVGIPIKIKETACDFIERFDKSCISDEVDEMVIIFI